MSMQAPRVNLDTFNELVGDIYAAASDVARWPAFIQHLTHSLNAHFGLLRIQNLQANEVGTYVTYGVNPDYQQKYIEHYIHNDPLIAEATRHKIGTLVQTAALLPTSFRKMDFFNDHNSPQGKEQIIGALLLKNKTRIALLGVHRRGRAGVYAPHEVQLIKLLLPHLQKAFQINDDLFQLKDNICAAHEALHRLLVGVILVDATGKPIFINHRAETLLSRSHALTLGRFGLQARTPAHTQVLHKLIAEANLSPQQTGAALSITTPRSPHPLSILVLPINRKNNSGLGIDASQASAALFISIAGQDCNFSLDMLCNLYGLTQAEARLAGALANGLSLEKIAQQFKLSKNTLRTQLKSCFQKTGVHRQCELVKLILGDPAALVENVVGSIDEGA